MLKKFKNHLTNILTKKNISKILIIFTVGLITRIIINNYFNINVFSSWSNIISLIYYLSMSSFIVFINHLIDFYNFSIIPSLEFLTPSNIAKILFGTKNKMTLYGEDTDISGVKSIDNLDSNDFLTSFKGNKSGKSSRVRSSHSSSNRTVIGPSNYSGYPIPQVPPMSANNSNSSLAGWYDRIRFSRNTSLPQPSTSNSPNQIPMRLEFNESTNHAVIVTPTVSSQNATPRPSDVSVHDYYGTSTPTAPGAPYTSNFSTPATMTPLFGSADDLTNPNHPLYNPRNYLPGTTSNRNSTYSGYHTEESRYTNDTAHAVVNSTMPSPRPIEAYYPLDSLQLPGNIPYHSEAPRSPIPNMDYNTNPNSPSVAGHLGDGHLANFDNRVARARAYVDLTTQPFSDKEVVVMNSESRGKAKVGFKYFNGIQKVYVKYHDISKRKVMWTLWERGRDKYDTYEEFKAKFNPKSSILKTIVKETRADISKEIHDLIHGTSSPSRSIDTRDIGRIGATRTQHELNNLNSSRYNSERLSKPTRRLVKIRKE